MNNLTTLHIIENSHSLKGMQMFKYMNSPLGQSLSNYGKSNYQNCLNQLELYQTNQNPVINTTNLTSNELEAIVDNCYVNNVEPINIVATKNLSELTLSEKLTVIFNDQNAFDNLKLELIERVKTIKIGAGNREEVYDFICKISPRNKALTPDISNFKFEDFVNGKPILLNDNDMLTMHLHHGHISDLFDILKINYEYTDYLYKGSQLIDCLNEYANILNSKSQLLINTTDFLTRMEALQFQSAGNYVLNIAINLPAAISALIT